MTPAEQLAAVVAKWRKSDGELPLNWDTRTSRWCANEVEPILAELQRAQGRLTVEQVHLVWKESVTPVGGINLIAFTHKLNALLSASTPAEPMGNCDLVSRPHPQTSCGKAWKPLAVKLEDGGAMGSHVVIEQTAWSCPNGDHACVLRGHCVNKNCDQYWRKR